MKIFKCSKCKEEINVRILGNENKNYLIKDGTLFCSEHCAKVYEKYLPNNVNELCRKPFKKYNNKNKRSYYE